MRRSDT